MRYLLLKLKRYWLRFLIFLTLSVFAFALWKDFVTWRNWAFEETFKYFLGALTLATALECGRFIKSFITLSNQDFEIKDDVSIVTVANGEIAGADAAFEICVERTFCMVALQTGLYKFSRECKGQWLEYTMGRKVGPNIEGLPLNVMRNEITFPFPVDIERREELSCHLKSRELIPEKNRHYALSISSFIRNSAVEWRCNESNLQGRLQAFLYSESFPLIELPANTRHNISAQRGFDLLIVWNAEEV